jgi:uncharacterized protein (UPF0212 family)
MKWCCNTFKSHYEQAGKRGSAILVGKNYFDNPQVTIQFRAVSIGNEEKVSSDILTSIIIDVGIDFCPWCGQNLSKFYSKTAKELFREGLKITY